MKEQTVKYVPEGGNSATKVSKELGIQEQYAVDAFRLHVSDFWLYPYTAERVEEAFRHLRHTPEKGITV